jgi:hypothetical protein
MRGYKGAVRPTLRELARMFRSISSDYQQFTKIRVMPLSVSEVATN